jgi:3-oxoacyl-[acyl-carrier protein] reductase
MGRKSIALKMDGRDYGDVQKTFATIKNELGPVEVLVNNVAQMRRMATIAKTTMDDWENEVKLCLNSAFYCIKAGWADMCADKYGRIINMTSVAGVLGGAGQTSYGGAKAGLIALAKSTALEGARFGITANCVNPGVIDTPMTTAWPPEKKEPTIAATPLARMGTADEVAAIVVVLASGLASFVNGAHVDVNGGLLMS